MSQTNKGEIVVTPEILNEFREMIRFKLLMWDASVRLEQLVGLEVDTDSETASELAAAIHDVSEINEKDVLTYLMEQQ